MTNLAQGKEPSMKEDFACMDMEGFCHNFEREDGEGSSSSHSD